MMALLVTNGEQGRDEHAVRTDPAFGVMA